MREVKLPSGAVLTITPSPFAVSKALYQALLKEARGIQISTKTDVAEMYKNIFCSGFSSPEIESCLWKCLEKCLYNNGKTGPLRITEDTFEAVEARQDYMAVCIEVAKENVGPFAKSLYAEYQRALATIPENPA